MAQKTKSGHEVKCGSPAALRLKGSISEEPRAGRGAIILGIWRWAQKTESGHEVKCGSTHSLSHKGSIF